MPSRLQLGLAVRTLLRGGVIAYPTEAVYGLGCMPDDHHALTRVVALKRRRAEKGLILIAADIDQVGRVALLPDSALRAEIVASWPGPVTWVLPARPELARIVTGGRDTVAVRVTNHPIARRLCARAGTAIVSTSANLSGRAPARSALEVRLQLGTRIDYILPGAVGGLARPTQIRDGATGRVLR